MNSTLIRSTGHYALAALIFAVYGINVCPFIESLSLTALLAPILIMFCLALLARFSLEQKLSNVELKKQAKHQFILDLVLFTGIALALAGYNKVVHNFPLESEIKVLLGIIILGFFISCDLSLFREFNIGTALKKSNRHLTPDNNPYPLTKKFSWFATICLLSIVFVVVLVINKDLHWLINRDPGIDLKMAKAYILGEVIFVICVMMAYVLLIILSYSRNLKAFISTQNCVLTQVTRGDLSSQVAVISNDEFGLIAQHTNVMISALTEQSREINLTRDICILSLATLAETRDNETGGHIMRTQNYVKALALELRKNPKYAAELDDYSIELLFKSAPLHDIGKVGIPDSILLKPGKLTDEEFSIMKQHPQIGADALERAKGDSGGTSFLSVARDISLTHHEKWDGSGYPNGLREEKIPLSGRLMALADVYDALITKRVYKPAFSHDKAKSIIIEGNGSHFDPTIIDVFLKLEQRFVEIALEFKD
ncbi:MAG: HD domain-containing protein [Pseudomonadales bacterium]|nr:HD domain-containing protein [Pseudomonadales bacterium]NRA17549.1 HD domain-containing protein [Oceanospirillaceae bacterium]